MEFTLRERTGSMDGVSRWSLATVSGRRVGCGNPECAGPWLGFLKDRRRPMFEGRWGCSTECMTALIETHLRRQAGEDNEGEFASEHRHRMPLGLVLLAQGWISNPQLQRALEAQRRAGRGRIGGWLTEECGLERERIMRGLGFQWGCAVLSLEGFDPRPMALAVPRVLMEQTGIVPLRSSPRGPLYVGFEDRLDASAALALESMSGLKVESGLLEETLCDEARRRLYACECVPATVEQVGEGAELVHRIASAVGKMRPVASRLVRVHEFYWLRMWLETGALRGGEAGVAASSEDVVDRIYTTTMKPL
jgi:Type II secretion system (T2SS), protein E, N-terminal domain